MNSEGIPEKSQWNSEGISVRVPEKLRRELPHESQRNSEEELSKNMRPYSWKDSRNSETFVQRSCGSNSARKSQRIFGTNSFTNFAENFWRNSEKNSRKNYGRSSRRNIWRICGRNSERNFQISSDGCFQWSSTQKFILWKWFLN